MIKSTPHTLSSSSTSRPRILLAYLLLLLFYGLTATSAHYQQSALGDYAEHFFYGQGPYGLLDNPPPGEDTGGGVSTGTTMVAAKYQDGVVIGADSRSVKGGRYVVDRFTDKIVQVSDHVCLACSGKSAVVQRLGQEISNRLRFFKIKHQREPTSRNAAYHLRYMMRRGFFSTSSSSSSDQSGEGRTGLDRPPSLSSAAPVIVAMDATDAISVGWSTSDGPSIFQVLAGGTVLEAKDYAVSGTGATYVIGYMDLHYPSSSSSTAEENDLKDSGSSAADIRRGKTNSMTKEECEDLVKRALSLASGRDSMSGGAVTVATIDARGVHKITLSPQDMDQCLKKAAAPVTKKGR